MANINGTVGDDLLLGTGGPDVISAGDGNDVINGRGGSDQIDAGDGNDTVFGGRGDDVILLGTNDSRDLAVAGAGDDTYDFTGSVPASGFAYFDMDYGALSGPIEVNLGVGSGTVQKTGLGLDSLINITTNRCFASDLDITPSKS